jgi:hypothetical protein
LSFRYHIVNVILLIPNARTARYQSCIFIANLLSSIKIIHKRIIQGGQVKQKNGSVQNQYDGGCVNRGMCPGLAKNGRKKR